MRCYECNNKAQVLEVREREIGGSRRRYLCKACGLRFSTVETIYQAERGGDRQSAQFSSMRGISLAAAINQTRKTT